MKKAYIIIFFWNFFVLAQTLKAQNGGGFYEAEKIPCVTPQQHDAIVAMLKANEPYLRAHTDLYSRQSNEIVLFDWPLRQAAGFNDPGFYAISNYVDENKNYPNLIQDYNCGNRSYDLASGYNHQGTDIYTFPFSWNKMNNNAVEIIAAAAGTIIGKSDGNYDKNCAMGSGNWNAVYVQHSDGSVAWYGHMKSGSLTTKSVGSTVTKGEYLGLVGSSGSSTGPHLHFEVYTSNTYTTLVDPWAGTCNALNGNTSWWASQQAYHVPTLNKIQTHSRAPVVYGCDTEEKTNFKNAFQSKDTIIFGLYFRDQENGTTMNVTIYKPDNSIWTSWSNTFNVYYSSSYWYWTYVLPTNAPTGTWRFVATYNGKTVTHNFTVGTVSSVRNDESIPKLEVFPNPANKEFFVKLNPEMKVEEVEVYNNVMQKVSTQKINQNAQNNTVSVDVQLFSKGMYFIVLKNDKQEIIGQSRFLKN
ncbi:MAG: peptidoglycan DD-metalloendopeptidase family protein [Chitinophagales bacterium]